MKPELVLVPFDDVGFLVHSPDIGALFFDGPALSGGLVFSKEKLEVAMNGHGIFHAPTDEVGYWTLDLTGITEGEAPDMTYVGEDGIEYWNLS